MLSIQSANDLCRLLSDSTRLRLMSLLGHEELTVAELTQITGLAQSRVSTHLGKLREAGLVQLRRNGSSAYYGSRSAALPEPTRALWAGLEASLEDATLTQDRARARELVTARTRGTWADSVAGQMTRHYSPGRTWESVARGLSGLLRLGEVLDLASGDGAMAELLAPHARRVTCVDVSPRVVEAGRERLAHLANVRFVQGDMHEVPLESDAFDQVMLMNALTYAASTERVLREAHRLLRPGGDVVLTTLERHEHIDAVAAYDHLNPGFAPEDLARALRDVGFEVRSCDTTHEERRTPNFRVITAHATKRESQP